MDIATLKDEARSLEQQGQTAEALALYRKILAHLEGSSGILRELPLYVKAGDLNLKLGDAKTAVAMYERAAKRYAQYGSSKSVVALCIKILRVDASRTSAYLNYARLMIERKHVAEAANVLSAYSERVKLGKAHEVLQGLAEAGEKELRPILEMLLEVAGRAESAKLQTAEHPLEQTEVAGAGATAAKGEKAEPVSAPHPAVKVADEAPADMSDAPQKELADAGPDAKDSVVRDGREPRQEVADVSEAQEEPEPGEIGVPRLDAAEETRLTAAEHPPKGTPAPVGDAQPAKSPSSDEPGTVPTEPTSAEPVEKPAPKGPLTPIPGQDSWAGTGRMHEQQGPKAIGLDFSQTIEPPVKDKAEESQKSPGRAPVETRRKEVQVSHLAPTGPRPKLTFTTEKQKKSLPSWVWVAAGVIVVGGAGAGLVMTGVVGGGSDATQSQTGATDSAATSSSASDTGLARPQALEPTPALGDSLAQAVANIATPDVTPDSLRQIEIPNQDPAGTPAGELQHSGPLVVVEGLEIQSVEEFAAGGHRVVHLLDSGEALTLMAIPAVAAAGDTAGVGQVSVRALAGDSSLGTVRFGAFNINARGRIPMDVLRGLLGRLVIREP